MADSFVWDCSALWKIGYVLQEMNFGEVNKMIDTFIACMKQKGWGIELYETRNNYLPEEIAGRCKNVQFMWIEFIATIKEMMCPDETEWFLCVDDFDWRVHTAWQWNEWELISLKSTEGDDEWKESITNFRNNHLSTTIYLWLIPLTASKKLPILLLKLLE